MNKTLLLGFGILFAFTFAMTPAQAATNWDVTGTYVWDVMGTYFHDITLVQNPDGTFTGTGSYPAVDYVAAPGTSETGEVVTNGVVSGNDISFRVTYTGPFSPDASFDMTGTINEDGEISGTSPWAWQFLGGSASLDTDGDGVSDEDDFCPEASEADGPWSVGLGNNRLEVAENLMWVQNKVGKKGATSLVTLYGIDYTYGCNGHQIIELLDGVMNGHLKYGVTAGLVEEFHTDLSDGELDGMYFVETVLVNSALVAGANSSVLVSGQEYRFDVSGTWTNRPGESVDAKFTTMNNWSTWTDAPEGGYHEDLIELQVNNAFVDWGTYSSAHAYSVAFTPAADASVNFRVFDGDVLTNTPLAWYSDNVGTLTVKVYAQI